MLTRLVHLAHEVLASCNRERHVRRKDEVNIDSEVVFQDSTYLLASLISYGPQEDGCPACSKQ